MCTLGCVTEKISGSVGNQAKMFCLCSPPLHWEGFLSFQDLVRLFRPYFMVSLLFIGISFH